LQSPARCTQGLQPCAVPSLPGSVPSFVGLFICGVGQGSSSGACAVTPLLWGGENFRTLFSSLTPTPSLSPYSLHLKVFQRHHKSLLSKVSPTIRQP
jgi:hypothetical protein